MGAKVLEEAAEVVEAAQSLRAEFPRESSDNPSPERQHLIYEACDVLYHLWVLLGSFGIEVDELRAELARREGTSGLEEKRQRQKNDN
jgi:phosphoribosyl-ATP pyrophosphohydrolase